MQGLEMVRAAVLIHVAAVVYVVHQHADFRAELLALHVVSLRHAETDDEYHCSAEAREKQIFSHNLYF